MESSVISDASKVFVALFGIDSSQIACSIAGCTLGSPLAPQTTWPYAIARFISSVIACALFGTLLSTYFSGSNVWRNSFIVIGGMCFHPLFGILIDSIPMFVVPLRNRWLERIKK